MARVFPARITAADVASLRAALDSQTPALYKGGKMAFFDLADPLPAISIKLESRSYDVAARRAIEAAIAMLPHFQSWVVALHAPDGANDGSDDHGLATMEIDGDEVYLHYVAISYNSDWSQSFCKGCAGLWYPSGGGDPLPEPPGPCRDFDPVWLAWNKGVVRTIAQTICDDRCFEQMPILADALEEAGCDNADILAHCREPDEHQRRCWVLDIILSRDRGSAAAHDRGSSIVT